jgi:hypothetical protein
MSIEGEYPIPLPPTLKVSYEHDCCRDGRARYWPCGCGSDEAIGRDCSARADGSGGVRGSLRLRGDMLFCEGGDVLD